MITVCGCGDTVADADIVGDATTDIFSDLPVDIAPGDKGKHDTADTTRDAGFDAENDAKTDTATDTADNARSDAEPGATKAFDTQNDATDETGNQ